MLRMAHRILSQGVVDRPTPLFTDATALCVRCITSCPLFIVDNTVEEFLHDPDFDVNQEIESRLPVVKSPYDQLWVEFETNYISTDPVRQVGYIVNQFKIANSDDTVILFYKFVTITGTVRTASVYHIVTINKAGIVVKFKTFSTDTAEEWEVNQSYLFSEIYPVLKAFCLCMCQNKPKEEDASEKFNPPVKWTSRQGLPRLKYRILDINGIKSPRSINPESIPRGHGNSLHQVRGHFATYTEDKPLFGRLHGTFWIPSHARGDIKNGAVIKDYSVSPPQPQQ